MMPRAEVMDALVAMYNLRWFGTGVHPVRDEHGEPIASREVEALWLAHIRPSHHDSAYLAVLYPQEHDPLAVFFAERWDASSLVQKGTKAFPASTDRVAACLKQVDIFPQVFHCVLDGIHYSLHLQTQGVNADIEFANPNTESWCAVEKAMFEMGEYLARMTEDADMLDYVEMWRSYLKSRL